VKNVAAYLQAAYQKEEIIDMLTIIVIIVVKQDILQIELIHQLEICYRAYLSKNPLRKYTMSYFVKWLAKTHMIQKNTKKT